MGAAIFQLDRQDATMVIAPQRSVTSLSDDDVKAELAGIMEALESGDVKNIVFDFNRLEYCGSSMLEAMRRLWKNLPHDQGKLVICCANQVLRDILHVTRFDTLWPIYATRE
ncbi:MAG: STAS domain-containing protein, partial [Planctomycetes bacterium]|nr:STAS domain-containing protein [Planctomycetota bacterium]